MKEPEEELPPKTACLLVSSDDIWIGPADVDEGDYDEQGGEILR